MHSKIRIGEGSGVIVLEVSWRSLSLETTFFFCPFFDFQLNYHLSPKKKKKLNYHLVFPLTGTWTCKEKRSKDICWVPWLWDVRSSVRTVKKEINSFVSVPCFLVSYSSYVSGDAYHITQPHGDGKGAILAMTRALKQVWEWSMINLVISKVSCADELWKGLCNVIII